MHHHTYLFSEGTWVIEGVYFNEVNQIVWIEGKINVLHKKDRWLNCIYIKICSKHPFEFYMNYTITPFNGKNVASWECVNTIMGFFCGKYVLKENTINCVYEPDNKGNYSIHFLKKIDDTTYDVDGMHLNKKRKIAYWKARLKAVNLSPIKQNIYIEK